MTTIKPNRLPRSVRYFYRLRRNNRWGDAALRFTGEARLYKAISMGKAVRSKRTATGFTTDEIERITAEYIHCSANWNAIKFNPRGQVYSGSPLILISFTNRPDKQWRRTVYNMQGEKQ